MGMAASQARFLGLTARKVNVEFQGQQINQARTSLANETANLYNDMLALKVPVPPSVADYYNTSYTYTDGNQTYEIVSGLGQTACETQITTKEYVYATKSVNNGAASTISFDANKMYLNGNELTQLTGENGSNIHKSKLAAILEDNVQLDASAPFVMTNGSASLNVTNKTEYEQALAAGYSFDENSKNNVLYGYKQGGTFYFIQSSFLPNNDGNIHQTVIPQEFYEKETNLTSYATMTNCSWGKDSSGRYTSVTGEINGNQVTYDLEFQQTEDAAAYEQATLDYEYQKALYDKEIENINAKTKKIQEQDRGLEMQLRQCDTEQEALAKELEAIKKLISDNVDKVFKTFA